MITSDRIRSTVTSDGVVLLDVGNGKIFNSNAVGSRIWVKLQEGLPIDLVAAHLSTEFTVSPDRLRRDIEEFIEQLKANGIVLDAGD